MNNTPNLDSTLQQICEGFRIEGQYVSHEEIKVGNVNRTYKVNYLRPDGEAKAYIVQRLNTYVFQNPIQVMENIDYVTEHIRRKNTGRVALHFHHTHDRKTYIMDEGGFWRLFNYIPSVTYNCCENLQVVYNAGKAFGEFQMALSDFDAGLLHEHMPGFHDTIRRYENMEEAATQNPLGRVAEVEEELRWLASVKEQACTLVKMRREGKLPLRVTHNDTKINNVLFEKEGDRALVVIDLDTVMPGIVGADFGDAIRSACNFVEEDSPEAEKAGVNMDVFRAFAEGFLFDTARTLTGEEVETLALSPFMMTVELAVRFLEDYLRGDPYFKTDYDKHNLVRTRCQIALAKDMLRKLPEMDDIIRQCVKQYR